MANTVFCLKLKKEAPGLSRPPFPGELGTKIFENTSEEAWQMWLKAQTMIINENRLNLMDPASRVRLQEEMERFLFEDEEVTPAGFKPPSSTT